VFEILANLARNLMLGYVRLKRCPRQFGQRANQTATPTMVFDPFLISAMRPRTKVLRERISQVFFPAVMRLTQGSSMTRPFTYPPEGSTPVRRARLSANLPSVIPLCHCPKRIQIVPRAVRLRAA
jgi:hypothetical protein